MPSMFIIGRLQTRPFASDDLHFPALLSGTCRLVQLGCVAALWIYFIVRQWRGDDNVLKECKETEQDEGGGGSADGQGAQGSKRDAGKWMTSYIGCSFTYTILDLAFLVMVWKASAVGTPTQPRGREKYLRPLLRCKIVYTFGILTALVVVGILMVHFLRLGDFGCSTERDTWKSLLYYVRYGDPIDNFSTTDPPPTSSNGDGDVDVDPTFDETGWYVVFCIILVSQALELLIIPAIVVAKVFRWIKRWERLTNTRDAGKADRGERFIGGCLQFAGLFSCFKSGGHELGANMKGELRDSVDAMLEYFNLGGTMRIVFSDLYVAFKMLSRVQRERKHECVGEMLKLAKSVKIEQGLCDNEADVEVDGLASFVTAMSQSSEHARDSISSLVDVDVDVASEQKSSSPPRARGDLRGSVFALEIDEGEARYRMKMRSIISPSEKDDKIIIKEAAHFMRHARAAYGAFPAFVDKTRRKRVCGVFAVPRLLKTRQEPGFLDDEEEGLCLEEIGFPSTSLVYLQPDNGIDKTPYCILVDHEWKTVIVAIRGTVSFEDMVIDLQLTPSMMDEVGREWGFDGEDQFCHRGVLTRSRWLCGDLDRHRILTELLYCDKPRYPGYRLVVTGHSLGAGCAALVSMMLRQRFPALQCYAFCPPGGLLTRELAELCEEFVVSVVNDTDIIPRMSHDNLERMRDEAFEVLARVRCSKMKLIQVLSKPWEDRNLAAMNASLLFEKDDVPKNTEYYVGLETFKALKAAQRARSNAIRVPLYPPGKIISLVKSKNLLSLGFKTVKNRYTPQWAEKEDFNEILLSRTAIHDHGAPVVEENLSSLLKSFENEDDDDVSVESAENEDTALRVIEDVLVLENSFSCCSCPTGSHSMVPALLGIVALLFTALSSQWCEYVSRNTSMTVARNDVCKEGNFSDYSGIGYSMGLWGIMEKDYSGSGSGNNTDSWVDSGVCLAYPLNFQADPFLRAARLFSVLCFLIGMITVIALFYAACHSYQKKDWCIMSTMLLLASIFQGLVFLIFNSKLCNNLHFAVEGCAMTSSATCSLGLSAKLGIAAAVIWFFAAVSAARVGNYIGKELPV